MLKNRGVTIHDATIRYVSRYKPQDTVYNTIRKTRDRLQLQRDLIKALVPQNEKTKTEYMKNNTYNIVLVLKQNTILAYKTGNHVIYKIYKHVYICKLDITKLGLA